MNDPQRTWADLEAKQRIREFWLRKIAKRPTFPELIEIWLAGPEFVELPVEQLAILESYLKQPIDALAIQAERKRNPNRESETCDRRNKLKRIRDYNLTLLRLRQSEKAVAETESGAQSPSGNNETPLPIFEKACHRAAYLAAMHAEEKTGKELTGREAWEYLDEHGTEEIPGLGDYVLPARDTFESYLSKARKAIGSPRYERRQGNTSRSVVRLSELD